MKKLKLEDLKESCFYPLLVNVFIGLHGYQDLMSKRLISELGDFENSPQLLESLKKTNLEEYKKINPRWIESIDTQKNEVIPPLFELNQFFDNVDISVQDVSEVMTFENNESSLKYTFSNILGGIIIAFEEAKSKLNSQEKERSEIWQFFKHIRNAAAHGGQFHFNRKEPKFAAKWGQYEIVHEMKYESAFEFINSGMLSYSNIIDLLLEVEATHPQISELRA